MGKVVDFVPLRCMREYAAINEIQNQADQRQKIKDWKQRYKHLLSKSKTLIK